MNTYYKDVVNKNSNSNSYVRIKMDGKDESRWNIEKSECGVSLDSTLSVT
jgi:hypothetical protein